MIYPTSFKYEIIKGDKLNILLKCDARSIEDINVWVVEFGRLIILEHIL